MNNKPELTTICPRTKREFTIEEGSEEFILKVVSLENNAFRLDLYQQGFRLAGRKERPQLFRYHLCKAKLWFCLWGLSIEY